MFDARADDVAFSLKSARKGQRSARKLVIRGKTYDWNDMSHAVSAVDDDTSQRALLHWSRSPTGGEGQHCLHRNVEPRYVECLEHDFGRVLAVLGRVERRFREQEVMIARLGAQILEDALLEETLHQVPVFDDSMTYRILKQRRIL